MVLNITVLLHIRVPCYETTYKIRQMDHDKIRQEKETESKTKLKFDSKSQIGTSLVPKISIL